MKISQTVVSDVVAMEHMPVGIMQYQLGIGSKGRAHSCVVSSGAGQVLVTSR